MTDRSFTESPADRTRRLCDGLAATVEATPGVIRLQPTLRNAVRRLRSTASGRLSTTEYITHTASEGITLTERGDVIDIQVEITARTGRSADLVALDVQNVLRAYILHEHRTPGVIRVAVLDLEE